MTQFSGGTVQSSAYHQVYIHDTESGYCYTFVRNGRVRQYGWDISYRFNVLFPRSERLSRLLRLQCFQMVNYPMAGGGHIVSRYESERPLTTEDTAHLMGEPVEYWKYPDAVESEEKKPWRRKPELQRKVDKNGLASMYK